MRTLPKFPPFINEFLLINFFIIDLLASIISSISSGTVVIKIISGIILWMLIFINFKNTGPDIKSIFNSSEFKRLAGIIFAFIFLLSISLIYSRNSSYGLFKLVNLLTGTFPAVFAFYYLINTINKFRIKVFYISVFIESLILLIAIILLKPFHFDEAYKFAITKWSSVIFGHFIGPVYFLFLIIFFKSKNEKHTLFFAAALAVSLTGIYISGSRAVMTGLIFFTPLFFILSFIRKELNFRKVAFYFSAAVFTFLFIYLVQPNTEILNTRYKNLFDISKPELKDDAINARIMGLEVSKEIFKKYPFTGIGFGGYKNYGNIEITNIINYPHNIFVEFLIELGITGLIFFLILLYLIFSSTIKVSPGIALFFLFTLWLALFSKSIPTNTLLWLGLAFYGLSRNKIEELKTLTL